MSSPCILYICALSVVSDAPHISVKLIDMWVISSPVGIQFGDRGDHSGNELVTSFPNLGALETWPVPVHFVQIPPSRCGLAPGAQLGKGSRASLNPLFTTSAGCHCAGHNRMWQPSLKALGRSGLLGSEKQPDAPVPCLAEAVSWMQTFPGEG